RFTAEICWGVGRHRARPRWSRKRRGVAALHSYHGGRQTFCGEQIAGDWVTLRLCHDLSATNIQVERREQKKERSTFSFFHQSQGVFPDESPLPISSDVLRVRPFATRPNLNLRCSVSCCG